MKRLLALSLLLAVMVVILAGCGGLSGKYKSNDGRTLEFKSGDNCIFQGIEGTYKVEDGRITFVFKGIPQVYSFTEMEDSIVIDGIVYSKVK